MSVFDRPVEVAIAKFTYCLVGAIFIGWALGPKAGLGVLIVAVGIIV